MKKKFFLFCFHQGEIKFRDITFLKEKKETCSKLSLETFAEGGDN